MRSVAAVSLAILGSIVAASSQAPTSPSLVIRGGMLLDPVTVRLRPAAEVVIDNGRVTSVSPQLVELPVDAKVIDAAGAILVPGLADLDVHGLPGPTTDFDYYASASLATGVTGFVTEAWSSWSKDQKGRASSGEVVSPLLYLGSPEVVSARLAANSALPDLASYRAPTVVSDPAQASAAVASLKSAGIDWVRIRGDVPAATARALIAAARRSGLRTMVLAGSTPLAAALSLRPDVVLGLGLFGQVPAAQGANSSSPPDPNALNAAANDSWRRARDADVISSATRLAKSAPGTAIAPQFLLNNQSGGIDLAESGLDLTRALDLLPKARRQELEAKWKEVARKPQPDLRAAWRRQQLFVKAWAGAGGKLAVASGAGDAGWPVPGFAVHYEAALLVAAGVSRADALRAALAGDLFGASKAWTKGARADFFVVEGSPVDDLANLARIRLVVRRGEVLEPARLLADARRAIRER